MRFRRRVARAREWLEERFPSVAQRFAPKGQDATPYASSLLRQAWLQIFRAQAPGHGGFLRSMPRMARRLLSKFAWYDVSVMWGVDIAKKVGQLSPLRMAERKCAELFGAKLARFVTTGATHAAQAAALALYEHAGRKCTIAVQASVHISIIDALKGLGARVVLIPPRMNALGLVDGIRPKDLKRALKRYPEIGGVIVNVVSYEGRVAKMRRLVEIAHQHGVPLVADQSWCTELGHSRHLPESALQAGADVVIASPHKTLPVAGQAAWLFLGKDSLISEIDFGGAVREHLSTSKNSVLLALLDVVRKHFARHGERMIDDAVNAVEWGLKRLRQAELDHLIVEWDDDDCVPYRVVFDVRRTGLTGFEVGAMLRKKGIQVAQANAGFICCGFGLGAVKTIRATFRAMERIGRRLPKDRPFVALPLPPLRLRVVDFSDVPGSRWELVRLEDAVGRRAKFPLGAYPPGFCVLIPGAVISKKDVKFLIEVNAIGATMFGPPMDEVPEGMVVVMAIPRGDKDRAAAAA